ncbi:MAG TPA: glycosyltransferase family 4 protein, partial [Gemmatimonadaceae bacterium]|nr:glycosyltransferase family 4 protein [Gemmatimonadaceae bacterium]
MRILLVNDYATPTAGAERITLDLRDGFRARGHEVRVFASRAQLIAGVSFADTTCWGTTTRVQTLTSTVNLSAARALRRELRDFAPDVVQVQMFLWQLSPSIL